MRHIAASAEILWQAEAVPPTPLPPTSSPASLPRLDCSCSPVAGCCVCGAYKCQVHGGLEAGTACISIVTQYPWLPQSHSQSASQPELELPPHLSTDLCALANCTHTQNITPGRSHSAALCGQRLGSLLSASPRSNANGILQGSLDNL